MSDLAVYDTLAGLLAYPSDGFEARVGAAQECIKAFDPQLAGHLAPLARLVADTRPGEVEELYTRTFDMNPSCALELGWHLYGEDYDRGAFLVRVRDLMRRHGVEETGELPDHASHLLRLLPRLADEEAKAFSRQQALPAILKILGNMQDRSHPLRGLLAAARDLLQAQYGPADQIPASAFACPSPYDDSNTDSSPFLCPGMPPADPMEM